MKWIEAKTFKISILKLCRKVLEANKAALPRTSYNHPVRLLFQKLSMQEI